MEIVHVCFSIVIVTYTVIPCIADGGIQVLRQCFFLKKKSDEEYLA